MQQYKTVVIEPGQEAAEDPSTGAMIQPDIVETWRMDSTWNHSTNILGLVIFSVATGIAIGKCSRGRYYFPLLLHSCFSFVW